MHKRLNRLPSGAMLVAMVALVAALVGTASALPGRNSVDRNDLRRSVVKTKNIKPSAVTALKIRPGAVTTGRLRNAAVSSAKLADGAVTTAKLANGAVTTTQVADDNLTADDIAPGVLTVVAFGRINNPDPGNATIASGDVGLVDVLSGTPDGGRTDVLVEPSLLPGGSLTGCTVQATPAADSVANTGTSLGYDSITVATGPPGGIIQVQTRGSGETLNDFDYFIQVACAGV